jgi:hypothetical protein
VNRTEIANYALGIIGAQRISSLDETGPAAAKCKSLLPVSESHVLRLYDWPSHTAREVLPLVDPIPESAPFEKAYTLPSNSRVLGIEPQGAYIIERGILFTDATICCCRYILPPASEYPDELLSECIALHLATRLAVDMADDLQKQMAIKQELQSTLAQARLIAGDEGTAPDTGTPWWT